MSGKIAILSSPSGCTEPWPNAANGLKGFTAREAQPAWHIPAELRVSTQRQGQLELLTDAELILEISA